MYKKGIIFIVVVLLGVLGYNYYLQSIANTPVEVVDEEGSIEVKQFAFTPDGLSTNTAKSSIDLNLILDGGPGKDGIPAINNPKFIKIGQEDDQDGLRDTTLGIAVEINGESKFYPYSVLYWHEIVNDTLAGEKISVTFCPLCGTAIVYDRVIDGKEVNFGVSGKLYESNLLMYDDRTESLWSQSLGEAVVGDYLGTELEYVRSDLLSYSDFKKNFPNGLVLSEDTGYFRSYGRSPYGSYETSESLYFPVQNTDTRLHAKELMFVLPYKGDSHVFVREKLKEVGNLEYKIGEDIINISYNDGLIEAKIGDSVLPGYIEMWFSWATGHKDSTNVWIGE